MGPLQGLVWSAWRLSSPSLGESRRHWKICEPSTCVQQEHRFHLGRLAIPQYCSPAGVIQMCFARVPLDIAELAALELGKLAVRSPDSRGAKGRSQSFAWFSSVPPGHLQSHDGCGVTFMPCVLFGPQIGTRMLCHGLQW